MDLELRGRVAIVCASSKGIGRAAAEALGREGVRLALCARDETVLHATATELQHQMGTEVLAVPADLRKEEDINRLMRETLARFGRLDILINNTGGPPPGPFEAHDDAAWQAAFEALLLSVVRLTRLAIPEMRKRGWGRIVNVTSTAVKQPIPNLILSNSLRAAVVGIAKTLSAELAPDGITVNNVAPGRILTDRLASLYGGDWETARQEAGRDVPMRHVGEASDMGNAILFLCSQQAGYITGVTLPIDGGIVQSIL
ncbi:MAG TPA: SDR family oxidoreductase [Chloroflexota bacterium]|jgi:3-oxoacyl-[acyl-carrier protein] reductase|nr:SDR family oxidoreductase [Chloroflexota bacterium]